jgi:hypothetical protein
VPSQLDRNPLAVRWNVTSVTEAPCVASVGGAAVVRFAAMEFRILGPARGGRRWADVTYVMDPDRGDLVEVREEATALSWTPDGKRIVLSAYGSLRAVRPDGTGDGVILRCPPENGRLVMDWSPDGRWIMMTNPYGSATNVYVMRSDGGELFLVGSGSEPSWRPASG